MKLKKFLSAVLCVILVLSCLSISAFAGSDNDKFQKGVGPVTNGYAIDYRYFSPVTKNDKTKYPLVIWLHGMGNGWTDGFQLTASDISVWSRDEYQERFKGSGGAFIMAPRSLENKAMFWTDSLIQPLRSAIDDFIAKNKKNIDLSRIYIGGYSMGGRMTLKMAVAYPELFAAIFPICPKWVPDSVAAKKISNIPIWLTGGVADPLVNYFSELQPTWEVLISESNVAKLCRFSVLEKTLYPDGKYAPTPHHSWYAVNYDMFSSSNGNYPSMTTVNGKGEAVSLTYPDGMISWLSGFRSNYNGAAATGKGNSEAYTASLALNPITVIINFFKNLFSYIF